MSLAAQGQLSPLSLRYLRYLSSVHGAYGMWMMGGDWECQVSWVVLQLCPHFILIMLSPFIPALMREAWPNNILKASLTFKVGLKFY